MLAVICENVVRDKFTILLSKTLKLHLYSPSCLGHGTAKKHCNFSVKLSLALVFTIFGGDLHCSFLKNEQSN